MGSRLSALAVALLVTGCRSSDRAKERPTVVVSAPSGSAAAAPTKPELLVLVRARAPVEGAWLPNGDVVAVSAKYLWRYRPSEPHVAHVTPIAAEEPRVAAAARADVVVVLAENDKAYPFKDGKAGTPFAVGKLRGVNHVSDDGRILIVRERNGTKDAMVGYEIASGKKLGTLSYYVRLSPDGQFAISEKGIEAVADGALAMPLDVGNRTAAWIDDKAMTWGDKELVVVDPRTKDTKRYPAVCPDGDTRDFVDKEGKRALRWCDGKLYIVTLDGDRRVHTVAGGRARGAPDISFSLEGNGIVLDWQSGRDASKARLPIVELDPGTGKTRSLDKPPRRRREQGTPVLTREVNELDAFASPDKKYILTSHAVIDVATERDVVRWGPPDTPHGLAPLAAFLYEGGLEIASGIDNTVPMRLGPARKTRFVPPPLTQGKGCPEGNYEAPRVVDGAETLFLHYESGCVCTATSCRTTKLPEAMVLARTATRTLAARAGSLQLLDDAGAKPLPNEGEVVALTFAGDASAGIVTASKADRLGFWGREFTLREIDTATGTTRWSRPFMQDQLNSFQLLAAPRSFITVSALNSDLQAIVWPRGAANAEPTRVDAWVGQAVIQYPDGKVETFGDAVDSALACRDGETVRPFATCRSDFEVKGRFAIE